jgi:hypothetical protein
LFRHHRIQGLVFHYLFHGFLVLTGTGKDNVDRSRSLFFFRYTLHSTGRCGGRTINSAVSMTVYGSGILFYRIGIVAIPGIRIVTIVVIPLSIGKFVVVIVIGHMFSCFKKGKRGSD